MSEARVAFLVDARHVPGLTADQFEDALHLVPATGAKLFSRHAADLLAPLITEAGQPR